MGTPTKRYLLTSEIDRVKAKHKPFELVLPAVKGVGDTGDEYPSKTIMVPPGQLLPDEVVDAAAVNPVTAARLLLGTDYPHFAAAGGTGAVLFSIIEEHGKTTLGE